MTRDDTTDRMRDISHTNPYTGETFTTVYERGPAVTDGGQSDATTAAADTDATETETMGDVDHTPRNGEGANQVWERGHDDRVVPGDGHE
ncbi:hypothetical protein C454_15165 [Haloferax gibbonsii ATCC 33959]|uniref:Uncharacterized protein n=1 Tax=Haloferax gibbonsii (strain ATCC 33959 / DSM 4427 / JCM 8863 / NBRC 102184 / NCIMB 2188 / Ma 2.38) TaxID=1227459 RepID=M0H221_HALGM|nr:hypothetical protein [Haloferax gibbonsii]ELZ77843.1 hypothetical protein C454_15165 [Haloferax gibbonsii ATCC 33959]